MRQPATSLKQATNPGGRHTVQVPSSSATSNDSLRDSGLGTLFYGIGCAPLLKDSQRAAELVN